MLPEITKLVIIDISTQCKKYSKMYQLFCSQILSVNGYLLPPSFKTLWEFLSWCTWGNYCHWEDQEMLHDNEMSWLGKTQKASKY